MQHLETRAQAVQQPLAGKSTFSRKKAFSPGVPRVGSAPPPMRGTPASPPTLQPVHTAGSDQTGAHAVGVGCGGRRLTQLAGMAGRVPGAGPCCGPGQWCTGLGAWRAAGSLPHPLHRPGPLLPTLPALPPGARAPEGTVGEGLRGGRRGAETPRQAGRSWWPSCGPRPLCWPGGPGEAAAASLVPPRRRGRGRQLPGGWPEERRGL